MKILRKDLSTLQIQSEVGIRLLYVDDPTLKDALVLAPVLAQYVMSQYYIPVYEDESCVESNSFVVCTSVPKTYASICELIVFCYEQIIMSSMSDVSILCISELRVRWNEVSEFLWTTGVLGGS